MNQARYGISGYTGDGRLVAFGEARTVGQAHAAAARFAAYANVVRVVIEAIRLEDDARPHYTPIH